MPMYSRGGDSGVGGACRIRKRGCSSSSPSTTSSLLQKYRLKKAVLVRKRGGSSTTLVPTWKMDAGSPSSAAGISDSSKYQPSQGLGAPVSARKLATALWEMDKIEDQRDWRLKKETRGRSRMVLNSLPHQLSDPSHSPERISQSRISNLGRIMEVVPEKFRYSKHNHRAPDANLLETDALSQGPTPTNSVVGMKNCLKDLNNSIMTSKELLKLLGHIWGLKEKHTSAISLVSALRLEMDWASDQVNQLIHEEKSNQNTINYLKKQFAEERSAWKSKEEERIKAAVRSLLEELESEKRLKRRAERLNKKLGIELARTRTSLLKSAKELENERRSREIIEQVCNELVRGIGEDKAEVEELKRESAKVQEELEMEREMLQIADDWREERVHMKLSEAKIQFEEKNAAVDRLRNELEAYLTTKKTEDCIGRHEDIASRLEVDQHSQLDRLSKSCRANNLIVNEREEAGELEGWDEEGEWREERVHMKLSEAKIQFEEKNASVDRLRVELEAYLTSKKTGDPIGRDGDVANRLKVDQHSQLVQPNKSCRANNLIVNEREEAGELEGEDEEDDGVDSVDSDLHSIELHVDSNNKSCSWSFSPAATKDGANSDFVAEKKPGRITNCNQVPRSKFSLYSGMSISKSFQHPGDEPDHGIPSESSNLLESQELKLDQERYLSVKELRDRMLAASRIAQPRGLASPTRLWSRPQDSQDMIDCEGSTITEMVKAAKEIGLRASLVRNNNNSLLEIDPIQ